MKEVYLATFTFHEDQTDAVPDSNLITSTLGDYLNPHFHHNAHQWHDLKDAESVMDPISLAMEIATAFIQTQREIPPVKTFIFHYAGHGKCDSINKDRLVHLIL